MPCTLGRDALRGVQVRYGESSGSGSSGTKLSVGTPKYPSVTWFYSVQSHTCCLSICRFHEAALLLFSLTLAHSPFDLLPFYQWLLFSHIMSFLGKVILLKRSNGDRTPKHSIAAGLSTVLAIVPASMSRAPVTVKKQSAFPGHLLTLTIQDDSVMDRANNVIREGLNVLSPIAGGIPVAGTPLKASIDALLVVLNSINVSQRIPEYPPCVIEHSGRQGARIEKMLPT